MASTEITSIEMFNELEKLVESSSDMSKIKEKLEEISKLNPQHFDGVECNAILSKLLTSDKYSELKTNISKAIAEVTKNSTQRHQFTSIPNVTELLRILTNAEQDDTQPISLTIQGCRALGNLCYENQKAREIIKDQEGHIVLYNLFDIKLAENLDKELYQQFIKTRCGIISNYLVGSEELAAQAIQLNLHKKFQEIIKNCVADVEANEELLMNVIPPLSILGEMTDISFDAPLNKLLIQVLEKCTNPELSEMCLEQFQCQAENDDVKYVLAKEGLCEILYTRLEEKYKEISNNEDGRTLLKLACDLIVVILNGDDAMHYLYTTPFLSSIEKWLDTYNIDLLTTGVLALGNFARTDTHCTDMVDRGILKKLIDILAKNNNSDDDMKLQHALLSTLRNLVIPKPNKTKVIETGLVETVLPMLESHQPPVVFKLLGTLRMTIDGQEKLAMQLLQNEKLILQLIVWSKTIDYHSGVSAESLRLMAWLIKHAYKEKANSNQKLDDSSLKKFVQIPDAVDCMVGMLTSSHIVMQNEALIALCILSTIFYNSNQTDICLDDILIQCFIGERISTFITKNADSMTKEIVENLQTLIQQLRRSEKLIAHLNQFNLDESIKSIPSLTEYCTL